MSAKCSQGHRRFLLLHRPLMVQQQAHRSRSLLVGLRMLSGREKTAPLAMLRPDWPFRSICYDGPCGLQAASAVVMVTTPDKRGSKNGELRCGNSSDWELCRNCAGLS